MSIQDEKARQIELLQENLQTIRKLAGWSIDDLGERIGVTKQTISNIENRRTTMTLSHYIAIRAVLDYEMKEQTENEVLSKSVALLLDEEANLNREDYEKIKESINTIAAANAGGAEKTALSNIFNTVVETVVTGMGVKNLKQLGSESSGGDNLWIKKVIDCGKSKRGVDNCDNR